MGDGNGKDKIMKHEFNNFKEWLFVKKREYILGFYDGSIFGVSIAILCAIIGYLLW